MSYRAIKILHGLARASMLGLLLAWLLGGFGWTLSAGCLLVSGVWFVLTLMSSKYYLNSYAEITSRIEVLSRVWMGFVLTGIVFWKHQALVWVLLGGINLLAWSAMYTKYRVNKRRYEMEGHGPVPVGTWMSPPIEVIREGDMLLSGGGKMDMAALTEAAVGHGELVVRNPQTGELCCLSSYMAKGTVLNPLSKIVHIYSTRGHFLVVRPAEPLDDRQNRLLWDVAQIMLAQNARAKETSKARCNKVLSLLPSSARGALGTIYNVLPAKIQSQLTLILGINGYDVRGLISGRRASDRWTCIGACMELYMRVGVPIQDYGVGFLGLGTGWLDPILPVRFLYDPALRVLHRPDYKDVSTHAGLLQYPIAPVFAITDLIKSIRSMVHNAVKMFR